MYNINKMHIINAAKNTRISEIKKLLQVVMNWCYWFRVLIAVLAAKFDNEMCTNITYYKYICTNISNQHRKTTVGTTSCEVQIFMQQGTKTYGFS